MIVNDFIVKVSSAYADIFPFTVDAKATLLANNYAIVIIFMWLLLSPVTAFLFVKCYDNIDKKTFKLIYTVCFVLTIFVPFQVVVILVFVPILNAVSQRLK